MLSEVLGVSLRPEGAFMRVRDQRSGKDYPWIAEWRSEMKAREAALARAEERADRERERADYADQRADRADQRADREAAARRSAEARIAELEARLGQGVQRPLDDD